MRLEEHAKVVGEHGPLTHSINVGLRDPLMITQGDAVASAPHRAAVDGTQCVIDRQIALLRPRESRRREQLDRLHGQLSGPATKQLAERAATVFGDTAFANLAGISVAHLYNLRASAGCRRQRGHLEPTRSRSIAIGERRRPNGAPGYLRVDSVHQGDWDGIKGLYVINLVDAVTRFEVVVAVERISGHFLIPTLRQAPDAFPFVIRGFHSDNGSEYINHQLAAMLDKRRIEFTKSRARRTNDNALVESKTAAVVRKHLGYRHIPSHHAQTVNAFRCDTLTPYLNYHRPCSPKPSSMPTAVSVAVTATNT